MSTVTCGNCGWKVSASSTPAGDDAAFAAMKFHVCPFNDETAYLLGTEANAEHLRNSLRELSGSRKARKWLKVADRVARRNAELLRRLADSPRERYRAPGGNLPTEREREIMDRRRVDRANFRENGMREPDEAERDEIRRALVEDYIARHKPTPEMARKFNEWLDQRKGRDRG